MADEPLFFRDEGEMGDVFKIAQQIIEQTRLSRDERARVTTITEDRIKQLTGKFIEMVDKIVVQKEKDIMTV